jgi:hypothetical protein
MRENPISFLFAKTLLGPENTVIKNISGDDEQLLAQLAAHEAARSPFGET